jgi:class 3 adenylate cyclase
VGQLLDKILFSLVPEWQLNGTHWRHAWFQARASRFVLVMRFGYPALALCYVIHHFFVDAPLGLAQDPRWNIYRFGLAGAALVGFVKLIFLGERYVKLNELYYGMYAISACYLQSLSLTWSNQVSYFWGLFLALIFSIFLPFSLLGCLIFLNICLAVQWDNILISGVSEALVLGAFVACNIAVMSFKYPLANEVGSFITQNEHRELQAKIIQTQLDLNDQIQSFLPKKIRERLEKLITDQRVNIIQAIEEVLRVRERNVVAIFSDIRSFTLRSKEKDYIESNAIPNMKLSTDIVESHGGIPRQIGDLVFAYFDEESFARNLESGFKAAAEIIDMNEKMNESLPPNLQVLRFVIIDCGAAYVGNVGGVGSAREITAIGNCVNRLSRIDSLTKNENLRKTIGHSAILLSADAGELLCRLLPALVFHELNLNSLGLEIKDFPEERKLYYFKLKDQDMALNYSNTFSKRAS